MFKVDQKLKKSKTNYLARKSLLVLSIIITIAAIAILFAFLFLFLKRIDEELNWLRDVDPAAIKSTKEKIYNSSFANSPSYGLKNFLPALIMVNINILFISLIINCIAVIRLFLNKSNADKYFIYLIFLQLTSFCLFFFAISLSPSKINKVIDFKELGGSEYAIYQFLDKMNITYAWIGMFVILTNFILLIVAKTKYGYVKNDQIIAKSKIDTKDLEKQLI